MISEALDNLHAAQERLGCWPDCKVGINGFWFYLGRGAPTEKTPRLSCHLDPELLYRIVNRREHWNNAELGCWIEFDRAGPYLPDVHLLLCFFHAPIRR